MYKWATNYHRWYKISRRDTYWLQYEKEPWFKNKLFVNDIQLLFRKKLSVLFTNFACVISSKYSFAFKMFRKKRRTVIPQILFPLDIYIFTRILRDQHYWQYQISTKTPYMANNILIELHHRRRRLLSTMSTLVYRNQIQFLSLGVQQWLQKNVQLVIR